MGPNDSSPTLEQRTIALCLPHDKDERYVYGERPLLLQLALPTNSYVPARLFLADTLKSQNTPPIPREQRRELLRPATLHRTCRRIPPP